MTPSSRANPRLSNLVYEGGRPQVYDSRRHRHDWHPVYDLPRQDGDEPVGRVCRGCLRYEGEP